MASCKNAWLNRFEFLMPFNGCGWPSVTLRHHSENKRGVSKSCSNVFVRNFYQLFRNSRSLRKTSLGSGSSAMSGKDSLKRAITIGLCRRKKAFI